MIFDVFISHSIVGLRRSYSISVLLLAISSSLASSRSKQGNLKTIVDPKHTVYKFVPLLRAAGLFNGYLISTPYNVASTQYAHVLFGTTWKRLLFNLASLVGYGIVQPTR